MGRHEDVLSRMTEITNEIEHLGRYENLTRSQERKWRELQAEFDGLDTERKGLERTADLENLRSHIDSGLAKIERGTPGSDLGGSESMSNSGNAVRDNAKRMIERSHQSKKLPDYAAERATELITAGSERDQSLAARWITATGDDAYRSAFAKLISDYERGHLLWDAQEQAAFQRASSVQMEMRAMSHTNANGGYLVPFQLDPAIIITNAGTINPLREIARKVVTITDGWHGVSSAGVTAQWLAEAAESSDNSPTLAQPDIPVHKGSAFIPFSIEMEQDAVNIYSELTLLLKDGAERLAATGFTTGSGSGQPLGLITALDGTASEVAPTNPGSETFTSADVYKVQNALPPRWQGNARWMSSLAIANSIDQFETTNGAKKFPDIGSAEPVLLRKPFHENSDMDGSINPAATADNHVLVYGDFEQFVIADRIGTTVEVIPHLFGPNGLPIASRGMLMYFRTGSNVTAVDAFRMLNVATTA
ncbi:phage major capsid protein [Streptosporangium sp. NBC_01495]|uniref:phage major capsid protein n=1 Tax=Streptosporangium sp. NBC_01495 TaxID=2903899 RepID=UPI002E335256|nr:phage major capsid protein [Streptosporangium sp. NBC_01495]